MFTSLGINHTHNTRAAKNHLLDIPYLGNKQITIWNLFYDMHCICHLEQHTKKHKPKLCRLQNH